MKWSSAETKDPATGSSAVELIEEQPDGDLAAAIVKVAPQRNEHPGWSASTWETPLEADANAQIVTRGLGDDGIPLYREDGKVLKGPNFSPPHLLAILIAAGYQPEEAGARGPTL